MNWIDIAWPVMGGACLMLGMVHAWAWLRRPRGLVHLVFALASLSVAVISAMERMLMQSRDPAQYGELLRWAHVPGAVMFLSLALFVHLQFRASRTWLLVFVCLVRIVALAANFGTGENINYLAVDSLRLTRIFGGIETAVAVGEVNPWMMVGQLHIVAFIAYLADTMVGEWRTGSKEERWSALRVCGGILLFVLLVNGWRVAVIMGLIPAPDALVPAFLCVVVVMGHDLGSQFLRSADLSERLSQARIRLRESERKAELAARAGELGLWEWDLASGRHWLSDLALRLLGFEAGQAFDADGLARRLHADDRGAARQALQAAVGNGGDYRADIRVRTREGGLRHLSVRGQLEMSEQGAPVRVLGILTDVTERVRQEERFALAVEASPTAMLMTRHDGVITLANRQAEVVFGYPRSQLVGQSVDTLLPARARGAHADLRRDFLADASARLMGAGRELHGLHRDGHEIPVEVALNPIRVGDELFVLASIADISERRRLESEAARHRDELAHLSRVALLAELSGSLAHELNQPLTAILSNAQAARRFLARGATGLDDVAACLDDIVESDKRAGEVIRRLRAMLRKEPIEFRALDVNEVVADVMRILRSDLLNRGIAVRLELAPGLPAVRGDKVQLQQVLLNLVTNGGDAMAGLARGRQITLRTQRRDDGDVQVSVQDVGEGIAPDRLETIFQPFVSSKAEGMGLGLAVCTSIVESHHGRIWASNNDGPGASLQFTLPPFEA